MESRKYSYLRPPSQKADNRFPRAVSAEEGYQNENTPGIYSDMSADTTSKAQHNRQMVVGYVSRRAGEVFTIQDMMISMDDPPKVEYLYGHLRVLEAEGLVERLKLDPKVRLKRWRSLAPPLPDPPMLISDYMTAVDIIGKQARADFYGRARVGKSRR